MYRSFNFFLIFLFSCGTLFSVFGQQSKEIQFLSGIDNKNTVDWDFWISGGRKAGVFSKIAVPSHWEQQGFGSYNYGRDYVTYGKNFQFNDEYAVYRHSFNIPKRWKGQKISIVFEGSMTDTEVKINGQLAGPIHQGAFYRFSYDITHIVKLGVNNQLEVVVSKMSKDRTVNNAERLADYWIFGGIYRPVYLETMPKQHITWTAIDAKADGNFKANLYLEGINTKSKLKVDIKDKQGRLVASQFATVNPNDSVVSVNFLVPNPQLWTAETPNLYHAEFVLIQSNKPIYKQLERFGFRTVEVRQGDGIYVNGSKVKMKGVNRHVWWPETGRSVNRDVDLQDVKLIKEMNMNAVRCAHYPPDKSFLELCDSLGLYVLDELAGWQKAYSTEVGKKLVKELVIRDVNHPSVILWSNGNEGGHNKELIDEYGKYDLSNRIVIHAHHRPGNEINGIDCNHYEDFYSTTNILSGKNIYMPTEFLHAQDDGGGAAGLADMWELHWKSKLGAGGFIWNLADEGIVRTDFNNQIDINGVNAPDGILGPYRQKEGSFYAIREIYSPVHIKMKKLPFDFNGKVRVENRFHHTNLKDCQFEYKFVNYKGPYSNSSGIDSIISFIADSPTISPTDSGFIYLQLPNNWKEYDALLLTATDPNNQELFTWSWKVKDTKSLTVSILPVLTKTLVEIQEDSLSYSLKANGITAVISKNTGLLIDLANDYGMKLAFRNGPILVKGDAKFKSIKINETSDDLKIIEAEYSGNLKYIRWTMQPDGWLKLDYEYQLNADVPFAGVSFDFPESYVLSAKWLGNGPSRVWKNRLQGGILNTWERMYNDSRPGIGPWNFPEFKGYFSSINWILLNTVQGRFLVATDEDDLFVRLFHFHGISGPQSYPVLPTGDISFLDAIPAIGSKLALGINNNTKSYGPSGELNSMYLPVKRSLYFYFGTPKGLKENIQFEMPKENILID